MKRFPLLLAALLAVPVASAQTSGRMDSDRMEQAYQADLDRLGSDLDRLDRTMTGDMRADYTGYRQSYNDLRMATPQTAISDPAAVRQSRTDYDRRYDELAGNVYRARLMSARNRTDYIQAANDRVGTYDDQIQGLRMQYDAASGTARSDRARDLIQLRRQRDAYRDQVFSARGMTRTGFDDTVRRRTTDTLTRADADFTRARREVMMRPMNGTDGSSM